MIVKSYYAHVVFDISRFKDDEAFIMFKADSLCFVKGKRLVDKGFKTRFKSIMAGINYFYFITDSAVITVFMAEPIFVD